MRTENETRAFLQINADRMRFDPTASEALLRDSLEAIGFKFQYPIQVPNRKYSNKSYPYILDYFHEEKQIAIEVDGGVHLHQRGRDRRRDERLRNAGIVTIRISNSDVIKNVARTVERIREML